MGTFDADVLIIGAGAAGLAAAARLSREKLRIIILEARDRIGGRILTVHPPGLNSAVELGAEFVHGRSPESFGLITAAELQVQESSGQPFCSHARGLAPCNFWDQIEKVLEKMKKEAAPEQSFAEFVQKLQDPEITAEDKQAACRYVRGFHAAHPDDISVQSLIEGMEAEEKIEGDRAFRLPGGYDQLLKVLQHRLAESVQLLLNSVVKRARWKPGRVEVEAMVDGRPQMFTSPHLLSTLPLALLSTENEHEERLVYFDPPLTAKANAVGRLRVGHVTRVSMLFRFRFWEELRQEGHSLADMSFLFSHDPVFPTFWTLLPNEAPVLTAWAPADAAERLSTLPEQEVCEKAIQALARVLHVPVADVRQELLHAYTHNWQTDPYSRGAYSYIGVGGSEAQRELAEPLDHTIFFAGEATNFEGHHGTVHGAIASGYRAAQEIIENSAETDA